MPPTPQQSLQPSIEAMQLQTEVEDQESDSCEMEYEGEHRWTARDGTVVARMEQYLNENLGGHDILRRMDKQGEVLIWYRKCSGYARQRMGPKLMNCCKREQSGTKEHGKMSKRVLFLEDGRIPAREASIWKIEEYKKIIQKE